MGIFLIACCGGTDGVPAQVKKVDKGAYIMGGGGGPPICPGDAIFAPTNLEHQIKGRIRNYRGIPEVLREG